jgi:formiminotetrahydrofolate cyclodeaminase
MTTYSALAVADLMDALASNEPVPGGGSAAALAGGAAVSVLLMVAGLPRTKTGAAEEAAALATAAARLRPTRDALIALIDRDAAAYQEVVAAFVLPKGSDEEKAARSAAVQAATRAATETPLDTMRVCRQALRDAVTVVRNGRSSARSDAAVAVELLLAVVRGAGLNIDANLASLKDAAFAGRVRAERLKLEADGTADAEAIRRLD